MINGSRGKICKASLWFCFILVLICLTYERWVLISMCFVSEIVFISRLYDENNTKTKVLETVKKIKINENNIIAKDIDEIDKDEQFDSLMQNLVLLGRHSKK